MDNAPGVVPALASQWALNSHTTALDPTAGHQPAGPGEVPPGSAPSINFEDIDVVDPECVGDLVEGADSDRPTRPGRVG